MRLLRFAVSIQIKTSQVQPAMFSKSCMNESDKEERLIGAAVDKNGEDSEQTKGHECTHEQCVQPAAR